MYKFLPSGVFTIEHIAVGHLVGLIFPLKIILILLSIKHHMVAHLGK